MHARLLPSKDSFSFEKYPTIWQPDLSTCPGKQNGAHAHADQRRKACRCAGKRTNALGRSAVQLSGAPTCKLGLTSVMM